jgi:hypothetical protein
MARFLILDPLLSDGTKLLATVVPAMAWFLCQAVTSLWWSVVQVVVVFGSSLCCFLGDDNNKKKNQESSSSSSSSATDNSLVLLELVLQGPSTFDLALQLLQSNKHKTIQEVALWNYSSHTTVKIMETQAVVSLFQALARLPCLTKVSISFHSPFPVAALTAFFNEQHHQSRQRQQQRQQQPWYCFSTFWFPSSQRQQQRPQEYSSLSSRRHQEGLQHLVLHVVELAGSPSEIEQLALAITNGPLKRLELRCDPPCPTTRTAIAGNYPQQHQQIQQDNNHEEALARREFHYQRLLQNERALIALLMALQHHPTLRELSLAASLPWVPTTTTTSPSASPTFVEDPGPVATTLIQLVQTNACLVRLKLHLRRFQRQSSAFDDDTHEALQDNGTQSRRLHSNNNNMDDTWYMGPLAHALAHPSIHETSQLASLHLVVHDYFLDQQQQQRQDVLGVPTKNAFETMVRNNYNIVQLKIGPWGDHDINNTNDDNNNDTNEDVDGHNAEQLLHPGMESLFQGQSSLPLHNTSAPVMKVPPICPIEFFLGLNRLGRKRLLCDPNTTLEDWIQTVAHATRKQKQTTNRYNSNQELSNIFYWLTMNPSIITGY